MSRRLAAAAGLAAWLTASLGTFAGAQTPDAAALPPGCARFEVQLQPQGRAAARPQGWQVCRSQAVITWQRPSRDDVWRLQALGPALERSEHASRAVVTFSAGELVTLGVAADPLQLATVLGPAGAASGHACPPPQTFRLARRGADTLQACWDPRSQWPAWLQQSNGHSRLTWRLVSHTPGQEAARQQLAAIEQRRTAYRQIDAADFGDLQPFEGLRELEQRVRDGGLGSPSHVH